MQKDATSRIIDAKYKVIRKTETTDFGPTKSIWRNLRAICTWLSLEVLICAVNTSLFVRLLMKHLLNWG